MGISKDDLARIMKPHTAAAKPRGVKYGSSKKEKKVRSLWKKLMKLRTILIAITLMCTTAHAGEHWGIGDSWYEGKHQGAGGDDGGALGSHLPPPDQPAVIHHRDEIILQNFITSGQAAQDHNVNDGIHPLGIDPPLPFNDRKVDNIQIRNICAIEVLSPTCIYIKAHPKGNYEMIMEEVESGGHPF